MHQLRKEPEVQAKRDIATAYGRQLRTEVRTRGSRFLPRWFRPSRTVTAPDGRRWEIYVGRATGLRWRPSDYDYPQTYGVTDAGSVIWKLLEIPVFLFNQVVLPAVRYVLAAPFALARAGRSDRWTVEAVCWWPSEERLVWTVAASDRERVLARNRKCSRRRSPGDARRLRTDSPVPGVNRRYSVRAKCAPVSARLPSPK